MKKFVLLCCIYIYALPCRYPRVYLFFLGVPIFLFSEPFSDLQSCISQPEVIYFLHSVARRSACHRRSPGREFSCAVPFLFNWIVCLKKGMPVPLLFFATRQERFRVSGKERCRMQHSRAQIQLQYHQRLTRILNSTCASNGVRVVCEKKKEDIEYMDDRKAVVDVCELWIYG